MSAYREPPVDPAHAQALLAHVSELLRGVSPPDVAIGVDLVRTGHVRICTAVLDTDGDYLDVFIHGSSPVGGPYALTDFGETHGRALMLELEKYVDEEITGEAATDGRLAYAVDDVAHRCRDQAGYAREMSRRERATPPGKAGG